MFDIVGFPSSYRRPVFAAKVDFATGGTSAASQPFRCLITGMKTSAGTIVADAAPVQALDVDTAHTLGGAGSEVALMAEWALAQGAEVWMGATTEPSGGTQATVTAVVGGTWTAGGDVTVRVNGKSYTASILSSDTPTSAAAAIVAKVNTDARAPFTWASSTATVTGTARNKGARGKDWIVSVDLQYAPPGLTVALTGSAAVTSNRATLQRVRAGAASSGTGVDDVTAILLALAGTRWARIGPAQADATQAQQWEDFVTSEATPLNKRFEHLRFGHNGSSTNAISIAQTTLNTPRGSLLGFRNGPNHPALLAAMWAGASAAAEGDNPLTDWDHFKLAKASPQECPEVDGWTPAEQETLLHSGVTPVLSVNGDVKIQRAITTLCLNGTAEEDRCLDVGDAAVPDAVMLRVQAAWTGFRQANPVATADPPPGVQSPPEGVAHPSIWNAELASVLNDCVKDRWIEAPSAAAQTLPQSTWNATAKRIQSLVAVAPLRLQHQMGVTVKQQTAA